MAKKTARDAQAITEDLWWTAVITRDLKADGNFFYAITTTGIYCRPSCPSRAPKRENISFYASAADAEAAGFRPCRRCRPNKPSQAAPHATLVAHLCRFIESAEEFPDLKTLADQVGLSSSYVQRFFKAATGLTPKAYAVAHRARLYQAAVDSGLPAGATCGESGKASDLACAPSCHMRESVADETDIMQSLRRKMEKSAHYCTLNNGRKIYYRRICGDEMKPSLVFLHEGLGCTAMWKDFPAELCRRTGCPGLVYDRSGYGKSSPLDSNRTVHYLHQYALLELPEILNKLFAGRPIVLIGHSDGGSISLIFGAEKPAHLKAIITEAAHVFVEPETLQGIEAAVGAYKKGHFRGLAKYHGEQAASLFKAWADTWLSAWFKSWNIEYLLPSIACPLLVLQGDRDQYGTSRQVEAIVTKSGGPAESVLVENCGHAPHQEQSEKVLQTMADFITHILHREGCP
jgi:methylphosphotriester-DNA--protein-cysteine methyltransferase/alpha-beta hydrolase superfamily lysophospholipase